MNRRNNPLLLMLIAFLAGFLAVITFHQITLFLLQSIGFAPAQLTPYALKPTQPFGIPRVWSLALWGGVWGIVLAIAISFSRGMGYWIAALLFGALGPSLVNWFVVLPLHGKPIGGGTATSRNSYCLNYQWCLGIGDCVFIPFIGSNYR